VILDTKRIKICSSLDIGMKLLSEATAETAQEHKKERLDSAVDNYKWSKSRK